MVHDWSEIDLSQISSYRVVLSTRENLEGLGTSFEQNGAERKTIYGKCSGPSFKEIITP